MPMFALNLRRVAGTFAFAGHMYHRLALLAGKMVCFKPQKFHVWHFALGARGDFAMWGRGTSLGLLSKRISRHVAGTA